MAKKKNLSTAKTPASAAARAAAIDKSEQGLPLTQAEKDLIAGTPRTEVQVDPSRLDKVGLKKLIRSQAASSLSDFATIGQDLASLNADIASTAGDVGGDTIDYAAEAAKAIAEAEAATASATQSEAAAAGLKSLFGEGDGGDGGVGGGGQSYFTAPDGTIFTDLNAYNAYLARLNEEEKARRGQSAYDLLFQQFNQYGLGALVEPLKEFITQGLSQAEFTLRLRETDAYKKRFAANAQRIAKGLTALSEAEYIGLEDQYQNVMRNYGLPASYYQRGDMGRQEGFEKFIAGDVSAAELEDRIATAQNRVINANPEIAQALRQFYPDITNGDILAYALDPEKALSQIKRKITAAEIGGAALAQGLGTGVTRAEELAAAGITKEAAQQGYQTVAGVLPRTSMLGDIYAKQGLGPYTQTTAEQEVFGLGGAAEAERKRRQLSQLEQASFSGQSGAAGGALARERAGQF